MMAPMRTRVFHTSGDQPVGPPGRGRTDKKLISTLVIWTFFKFRAGRYFFKVWESFIFQKS